MTTPLFAGVLLVVLPVAYNVLFTRLSQTFDYPNILRRPTREVLQRFHDGGSSLVVTWWAFAASALLLAPAVVLVSASLAGASPGLVATATTIGVLASLVQLLGLIRWPFAVPHLARLATDPSTSPETQAAVDVTFQTLNRLLGVAIGEHLGYLLTGVWTGLIGAAIIQSDTLSPVFGVLGCVLAPLFVMSAFEFVGPFEERGWKLAGTIVPVVYIGWSVWLLAVGVGLIAAA